ncbi:MAG: ATP-binding protein [Micavibrio sp.]
MIARRAKTAIKKILPTSLLGRSLLILVTPLFLVQIITTFAFFDRHWEKIGERMAFAITGEVALLARQIEDDPSYENVARLQRDAAQTLSIFVQYKPGDVLARLFDGTMEDRAVPDPGRESFIAHTLAASMRRHVKRPFNIAVDTDEKWVEITVQLENGTLTATLPERRIFSSSGYVVLLWMVGSSIILMIIATLFMRNQIRPIRRLAIAAERFGKGRDVQFFKVEGAREVRAAARAFIDMRERLSRQIQQRTAMLAGVSHDLRTPLTRMKLQLSMMGDGGDVADLKSDLADMERMIEAYLQFARGEGDEDPVRVDLKELIGQTASAMNRERERVFTDVPEDLSILLRPVAFERAMMNLLGNALKYGNNAWVSARKVGEMIEICLDDDGPGIPESQHEDVFKPFYRGESSRNTKTGVVGLGLPIVQDIVFGHGGQIWLDHSPRGGLRVVIDLPV